MSTPSSRQYNHMGVFLPVQSRNDAPDRVSQEWPRINNAHVASKGFLLGDLFDMKNFAFLVQSVQTGELLVHKFMRSLPDGGDGDDDDDNDDNMNFRLGRFYPEPLELRISTWQDTLPSEEFPDANPLGVLPRDAPFFNKLKFWQYYTPDDDADNNLPGYSMYFEYCNGGDLFALMEKYRDRKSAVPEHFIWLVAEQLCLAIAYLHFGERPDVYGHRAPANWTTLYHRDLFSTNTFINYPPRGPGRLPAAGEESNAFPQIVVGDFGMAVLDGDDEMRVPPLFPDAEVEFRLWDDTYAMGRTLRELCQAHLPFDNGDTDRDDRRPNNIRMADLNAREGSAPDFSDELVDLLGKFEWDTMDEYNIYDLADPLYEITANSRWIVDTLYPAARARVAAYRSQPGRRPAGYFDGLDVSWTRPAPSMPFVYVPRYADLANGAGDLLGGARDDDPEVKRMKGLALLHQLEYLKPSFELRSLAFSRPTMRPLRKPRPRADSEDDAEGDDEDG